MLDTADVSSFTAQLLRMAEREFPNETKKFLKTEGNKLNKEAKNLAKKNVGKRGKSKKKKQNKERYLSGFKRGKVYEYPLTESYAVRIYNARPHAHLLEYGHEVKPHTRRRRPKDLPLKGKKQTEEKQILQKAAENFYDEYAADVERFVDDVLERGLGL